MTSFRLPLILYQSVWPPQGQLRLPRGKGSVDMRDEQCPLTRLADAPGVGMD